MYLAIVANLGFQRSEADIRLPSFAGVVSLMIHQMFRILTFFNRERMINYTCNKIRSPASRLK